MTVAVTIGGEVCSPVLFFLDYHPSGMKIYKTQRSQTVATLPENLQNPAQFFCRLERVW